MSETKDLLERQLEVQIEELATMESGSEEKNKAIRDVEILHRMKMDEVKLENDVAQRKEDSKHQRKDNLVKHILTFAGIAVPFVGGLIFRSIWYKRGFQFEETGTYCSDTFKDVRHDRNL